MGLVQPAPVEVLLTELVLVQPVLFQTALPALVLQSVRFAILDLLF